ncbi:MAG: hypothetical protein MUE85_05070 [Microscillaceae bacterium]|jgi:hypothetical protein|nr:hypothetical protein [Microscillaceae bacterium]
MLLENRKYVMIEYYADLSLLQYHWQAANVAMSEDEYKTEMLHILTLFRQYQVQNVILDALESKFVITIQLQEWVNQNIIAVAAAEGLKRVLVILSKDLIANLSMEQMFEEDPNQPFHTHYCPSVADAQAWLRAKIN